MISHCHGDRILDNIKDKVMMTILNILHLCERYYNKTTMTFCFEYICGLSFFYFLLSEMSSELWRRGDIRSQQSHDRF